MLNIDPNVLSYSYNILTCSPRGALRADGAVRVAGHLDAGAAVGAGAGRAVVVQPQEGVAVEALGGHSHMISTLRGEGEGFPKEDVAREVVWI